MDCWDPIQEFCDVISDPVDRVTTAYNWASDPFGSFFLLLQEGAASLGGEMFSALLYLTSPDLSAQWWLAAYAISFGAAILVMAVLILKQIAQASAAKDTSVAGSEVFQTLFLYVPIFLVAAAFGPVAGILVNRVINAGTEGLATWAMGGSYDEFADALGDQVGSMDTEVLTGGVIMGIILMLGYIVAFLVLLLLMLVQLVSLYLLGVVIPLGIVLMLNPRNRGAGGKLASAWLLLLLIRPLVVFLMGVAFHFVAFITGRSVREFFGNDAVDPGEGFGMLIMSAVSLIMMALACVSPFLLLKYAPVLGQAASSGPSPGPAPSSTPIGPSSPSDITSRRSSSGRGKEARASRSNGNSGSSAPGRDATSSSAGSKTGKTPTPRPATSGTGSGTAGAAGKTGASTAGTAGKAGKLATAGKVAGTAGKAAATGAAAAGTAGVAAGAAAVKIGGDAVKAGSRRARRQVEQAGEIDAKVIGEDRPS